MAINKSKIVAQAQKFVNKGQFEKAIVEYQKLLKEEPEDIRTWLKVGDLYTRMGANTEATQTYMKVAEKYTRSGFHLKAVAVYKQILKLDPMLHEVYEHLSESYLKLGLATEALIQLEQLVELLQRVGNDERMLVVLERMSELDPSNVATRLRIAEHRSSQGDAQGAIDHFVQAASELREQHRTDDFLKVAERMLFHDPSRVELAVEIAELYLERSQYKKALSKLQLSFMKNPRDLKTLGHLAESFTGLKQPEKAISVYREMALLQRERGDHVGYEQAFEKILEIDPENTAAKSALNRLPAESALGAQSPASRPNAPQEMPIPSMPPSAPADEANVIIKMLQEVGVLLKYGLKERAVEHVRQILKIDSGNVQAHETLKNLLLQLDKKDEATVHLFALAEIYSKDDPKAAVAYLTEALDINPENQQAIALLERLTQKPFRPASLSTPSPVAEPEPPASSLPATRVVGTPHPFGDQGDFPSRVSKFPDNFEPIAKPAAKPAPEAAAPAIIEQPPDDEESGLILDLDDDSELSEEIVLGPDTDELSEEFLLEPTDELTRRLTPDHLQESQGYKNIPAEEDVLLGAEDEEVLGIDLGNEPVLGAEVGTSNDTSELQFGKDETGETAEKELPSPLTFESIIPPSARSIPPAASMPPPPPSMPPKPRSIPPSVPAPSVPAQAPTAPKLPEPSAPPPAAAAPAVPAPSVPAQAPTAPKLPEPSAPPPAAAAPAAPNIGGELEEIEFYAKYGLVDEAMAALKPLLLRYPDDPRVHAATELVQSAGGEVAAAPAKVPAVAPETELLPRAEDELTPERFKPEEIAADIQEHTEPESEPPSTIDEFDEVFEKFKRGVKERVADTDFATHYDLGLAYREMDLIEDAISEFRIAAGDPNRAASTATMIGLCFISLDRVDDAILEFMKGLEEDHLDTHNELGLLYELGKAYQIKGQTDDAVSCFEEIQERDPKFADVARRLGELSDGAAGSQPKKGLFS